MSGRSLASDKGVGINIQTVQKWLKRSKEVLDLGIEIALVIEVVVIWRGEPRELEWIDVQKLTILVCWGLLDTLRDVADSLQRVGVDTRVQTAIAMQLEVAEPYIRSRALRHLQKDVLLFWS